MLMVRLLAAHIVVHALITNQETVEKQQVQK